MNLEIKKVSGRSKMRYIEVGTGEPLILLHGLLGALSNFTGVIDYFRHSYKVVVPLLPLYDMNPRYTTVGGMKFFLKKFIKKQGYTNVHLMGNSLGGHIALLYALDQRVSSQVKTLILTGSSGLFENGMGATFPKRNNYDYIKMKAQSVFYDPATATKELVDEVFEVVSNRIKALKIIYLAKSATRNYLGHKLQDVQAPTLLVWGKNDIVTPPFVAEEFHKGIPNSELVFIDKCGHAPMMEQADAFNQIVHSFLNKHKCV